MSDTLNDTKILLDAIEVEVKRREYPAPKRSRRIVGWSGPGVTFATRLKLPDRPDPASRGSLIVVTPHAHAAGWIMHRIDHAFAPLLGRHIRRDFLERIGEGVSEYCAFIPSNHDTDVNLLRVILREARDILAEMVAGEFPYAPQD